MKDWHVEISMYVFILAFLFIGLLFTLDQMDKQDDMIREVIRQQYIKNNH